MRVLSKIEASRLEILTKNQVPVALIEPTKTGLKKSILDATGPVRHFLKENGLHDYEQQKQGPENKVIIDALIYTNTDIIKSRASLYRPNTKKGDPRIWFSKLGKISSPNDLIAILFFEGSLHIFNLTKIDIQNILNTKFFNPLSELILTIKQEANEIALELLWLLQKVANSGPIPSVVKADTSVGRTLETALGIPINSSKQPDYKGIELKSFRSSRTNRKTLFAQVSNWEISKFKSSAEILDNFGYWRGDEFKLNCTVSAIVTNSQGLSLRLDTNMQQLIEHSNKPEIGDFVVWTLDKLHHRLEEKHKETFWVEAESIVRDGKEYFQYKLVEHTKKPIISQFDILIEQGIITLDHLIKRSKTGKVRERGPLFKIKPNSIGLLFPPSEKYDLLA